jgi:hypothetical protein
VVAVLVRVPFLPMVMCGEEGEIGRAVTKVLEGHRPVLVIARDLTGKEYTRPPWHNAAGYALPAVVFAPAVWLTGFSTVDERIRASMALRGAYLLLYGAALFGALYMLPKGRRTLGGFLLLTFSLFPLPLLGSVQVQYDGSVSTVLVVLSVALIARATHAEKVRHGLLVLAGGVISLGKLEYLLAGCATVALVAALDLRPRALLSYLTGAVSGLLLCGLSDSENLIGGYRVMRNFQALMAPTPLATRVPDYLRESLPYLWPLYVGLPIACIALLIDPQRRLLLSPVMTAVFIFTGYVEIGWHGDGVPRYFAPCFVLLPVALSQLSARARWIALATAALAVPAVHGYRREQANREFALCGRVGAVVDWRLSARSGELARSRCVPRLGMESAIGFYSRTAPFSCCGADWGDEWPELGAQLCR